MSKIELEYSQKNSESYVVNFWHTSVTSGFLEQKKVTFWTSNKNSHKAVEKFAKEHLSKTYKEVKIISVTFQ